MKKAVQTKCCKKSKTVDSEIGRNIQIIDLPGARLGKMKNKVLIITACLLGFTASSWADPVNSAEGTQRESMVQNLELTKQQADDRNDSEKKPDNFEKNNSGHQEGIAKENSTTDMSIMSSKEEEAVNKYSFGTRRGKRRTLRRLSGQRSFVPRM